MLQTANPASQESAPTSTSFAGLLAAFAAPASKRAKPFSSRSPSVDGLEDDVAVLSYDRALRAHSRYRASIKAEDRSDNSLATDRSQIQSVDAGSLRIVEAAAAEEGQFEPLQFEPLQFDALEIEPDIVDTSGALTSKVDTVEVAPVPFTGSEVEIESKPQVYESAPAAPHRHLFEKNLKTVSITIRVSSTECEQLRTRAAEAGLTVSAYLRSCTFEAESLRAMVKDTLSQMRSESSAEASQATSSLARSWMGWLLRLWPTRSANPKAGRISGDLSRASFSG